MTAQRPSTLAAALIAILGGAGLALAACSPPADKAAPAGSTTPDATATPAACVLTPVPEGDERKAILDALRPKIEEMAGKPVEFVVNRLETACDYARLIAQPQSKDGADKYETVDAFFVKADGKWSLSMIAAAEEGSNPAADQYKAKHPDAPEALLYL